MKSKYNIVLFSGSRAEFGLSENLICNFYNSKKFNFDLIIGGSHCIKQYGNSKNNIIKKYKPKFVLKYEEKDTSVTNLYNQTHLQISKILNKNHYDLSILVGDRYEIFALAYNCFLRKIPICHIHGGEKTDGSMDDSIRHAISKFSNIHFVANKNFKNRLIQMGEIRKNIHIVGGLGIDSLSKIKLYSKAELYKKFNLNIRTKIILVSIHPTSENKIKFKNNLNQFFEFLKSISFNKEYYFFFSGSSSDINSNLIELFINKFCKNNANSFFKKNFGHKTYSSLIKNAYVVIGNSSSGVIDTSYFKTPSINIGSRQQGRPISENVISANFAKLSLIKAFRKIGSPSFQKNLSKTKSYYGKPGASKKIYNLIEKKISKISSSKIFVDII